MRHNHLFPTLLLFCSLGISLFAREDQTFIWIEGDQTVSRDVTTHSWYNKLDRTQFSDETWISHYDAGKPGTMQYEVTVDKAGDYRFWVRANPMRSGLSWRLDEGAWQKIDLSNKKKNINVAADSNPDHRFIAWIDAGLVSLSAGDHSIAFRMQGGSANSGILDCFVLLTDHAWVPQGTAKPGEASEMADEGWFAWVPGTDPLTDDSPIDLRHLNEAQAGQSGFVRRNADGDGFLLGDGTPLRFVRSMPAGDSRELLPTQARRLAKYGVNLARVGVGRPYNQGPRLVKENPEALAKLIDRMQYRVFALREEGIYSWLDLYWTTGDHDLFFDPEWRGQYLAFIRALMTKQNPYTGVPLAEDPAVALMTIQNENNLLFHTFRPMRMEEATRARIERAFGDWLKQHYGSLTAAREAWGPDKYPHTISLYSDAGPDDWENGRIRLYAIAHLTGANWAVSQRNPQRAGDQLRFMTEAQKGFYAETIRVFREDFGVRCLITCSNWKTADARLLDALEHYSYSPGDGILRNIYFGPDYAKGGNERASLVMLGDTYRSRSSLVAPESPLAMMVTHMQGMPYMLDEYSYNRPNAYRAEAPFLAAVYGSLVGMDGWGLEGSVTASGWNHNMSVWDHAGPTQIGQYPAAALAYRQGFIAPADVAVRDIISLEDLYDFKGSSIYGTGGHDTIWVDVGDDAKGNDNDLSTMRVDPMSFFVGRVVRQMEESGSSRVETVDLDQYIDREAKTVTSLTREIVLDYDTGVVTIDAPRAQGATGFLAKRGQIDLGDLTIESGNDYASVLVVPLDGLPLADSRRILIQAVTEDRTYGFRTEETPGGYERIVNLGSYPLNVRRIEQRLTLKRQGQAKVVILNENGYPTDREARVTEVDGGLQIDLPEDALYTLVEFP
jgi:hypothetical protein